jgi:hypothetical protein
MENSFSVLADKSYGTRNFLVDNGMSQKRIDQVSTIRGDLKIVPAAFAAGYKSQ